MIVQTKDLRRMTDKITDKYLRSQSAHALARYRKLYGINKLSEIKDLAVSIEMYLLDDVKINDVFYIVHFGPEKDLTDKGDIYFKGDEALRFIKFKKASDINIKPTNNFTKIKRDEILYIFTN